MIYLLVGLPATLATFVILVRQYRSPDYREEARAFYSDRIALRYGVAVAVAIEVISVVDLGSVGLLTGVVPSLLIGSVAVLIVTRIRRQGSRPTV
jgi:hypothetical protein